MGNHAFIRMCILYSYIVHGYDVKKRTVKVNDIRKKKIDSFRWISPFPIQLNTELFSQSASCPLAQIGKDIY